MTEHATEFTSPVLSDVQVVKDRHKPPVIRCLITSAVQGSHRLILTNPKMILDPGMPPSGIAEKIGREWEQLIILEKHTQDLVSYELGFYSEVAYEFGVRVSECVIEQVKQQRPDAQV